MSKGRVGKSLKGYYTGQGTSAADLKGLLASLAVQGLSLNNVIITTATIYGGSMDDVEIGSIQPSSGTFTQVVVGNDSGTGGKLVAYGSTPGDYIAWDPDKSQLNVAGGVTVRDPSTLGNIQIAGNNISAVNTDGSINLIPNSPNAAVNVSGSLIQTSSGAVQFTHATDFAAISTQGAHITGNTGASLNSVTGGTAITSVSGPTSVSSDTGSVSVTAGTGSIDLRAGGSLVASTGSDIQFDADKRASIVAHDGPLSLLSNSNVQFRVDVPLTFLNDVIPMPVRGYQTPQIVGTSTDGLVFTASDIAFDDPILFLRSNRDHFVDSGIVSEYTVDGEIKRGFFGFQNNTTDLTWIPSATVTVDPITGVKKIGGDRGTLHLDQIIAGKLEGDPDLYLNAFRGTIYMNSPNPVVLPEGGGFAFGVDATHPGGNASIKQDAITQDLAISALRDLILAAGRNVVLPSGVPLVFSDSTSRDQQIVKTPEGLVIESKPPTPIILKGDVQLPAGFKFSIGDNVLTTTSTGGLSIASPQQVSLIASKDVLIGSSQGNVSFASTGAIKIPDDVMLQIGDVANVGLVGHQGQLSVKSVQDLVFTPQSGTITANAVSFALPDRSEVSFGGTAAISTLGDRGDLLLESDRANVLVQANQGAIAVSASLDVNLTSGAKVGVTAATGIDLTTTGNNVNMTATTGAVAVSAGTTASITSQQTLALTSQLQNVTLKAVQGTVSSVGKTIELNGVQSLNMQSETGPVTVTGAGKVDVTASGGKVNVSGATGVSAVALSGNLDLASNQGMVHTVATTGILTSTTSGNVSMIADAGSVQVNAGNGTIGLTATSGVSVSTTTGNVALQTGTGNVALATTSGNIGLHSESGNLTFDTKRGDVQLSATAGHVGVDATSGVSVSATGGDLALSSSVGKTSITGAQDTSMTSLQGKVVVSASQDVGVSSAQGGVSISAVHGSTSISSQSAQITTTGLGGLALDAKTGNVQFTADTGKVTTHAATGVETSTNGGDITFTTTLGSISSSANGSYSVNATSGVALNAGSGAFTARSEQDAQITSQSGNVVITAPSNAAGLTGNVSLKAGNGGVNIDSTGTGNISLQATNGNVAVGTTSGSLSLTATNGNATLVAGSTSTATVQGQNVILKAADAVSLPLGVPLSFGGNSRIYESATDGKLHITDPEGVVIDRNVLINGDITIIGESSRISSTTTTFHDGLVTLAPDAPVADKSDRGFEFLYHDSTGAVKWGMMGFSQQDYRFHLVLDGTNNREVYAINQPGDLALGSVFASGALSAPKVVTPNLSSGSPNGNLQIDGGVISLLPTTKVTLPSDIPFQIGASVIKDSGTGLSLDSRLIQVSQGAMQIGTTQLTTNATTGSFAVTPSPSTAGISLNAAVTIPQVLNFGTGSSPGASVRLSNGKDLLVSATGQFSASAVDNATITAQKSVAITSTIDTTLSAGGKVNVTGQDMVAVTSNKVVQVTARDGISETTPGYYTVASGSANISTQQTLAMSSGGNTTMTSSGTTLLTSASDMSVKSNTGALSLDSSTATSVRSNGSTSVSGATGVSVTSPVKVDVRSSDVVLASTHDTTVTAGNDFITTSVRDTSLTATRNITLTGDNNASLTSSNVTTVQGTSSVSVSSYGTASLSSALAVAIASQGTISMSAEQPVTVTSQRQVVVHSETDVSISSNNDTNINAQHDVNVGSSNNMSLSSDKAVTVTSIDSTTLLSSGNITGTSSNGGIDLSGKTHVTVASPGNVSVSSGQTLTAQASTMDLTTTYDLAVNSGGSVTGTVAQNFTFSAGGEGKLSSIGSLTASSQSSISVAANSGLSLTTTHNNVELRTDNGRILMQSDTYVTQGKSFSLGETGLVSPSAGVLQIVNTTDPTLPVEVNIHGDITGDCTWKGNPILPSQGGTGHLGPWLPTSIVFIDEAKNLTDRPDELCWDTSVQSMGIRTGSPTAEAAITIGSGHVDLLGVDARLRYYVSSSVAWTTGVITSTSLSSTSVYTISTVTSNGGSLNTLMVNSSGQVGIGVSAESMRTLNGNAGILQLSGDISFELAVGTAALKWDASTRITGDVANGVLTLSGRNKTVVTSRLACPAGIQWDDVSVAPSSATMYLTGDPVHNSLLMTAPDRIYLTSPHVIHSERICFAHGVNDSCTSYFHMSLRSDGTGRDLGVVNDVGDILLAPKNSVSLATGVNISFPGVGTIGSVPAPTSPSSPLLAITSVTGTVLNPGTSGLVTIPDGKLVLAGSSHGSNYSASLGIDPDGSFAITAAYNVPIKITTSAFVSIPDNVPLNFGSNQPPTGKISSDGDSLLIHSPDLITLSSNNVVVTGNFVVKKTSTFTVESETDFDSGIINLGGGQVNQISNISAGPTTSQTTIKVNAAHHLIPGDKVKISDTIPNIDGEYTVASVLGSDTIVVNYPFPGVPVGATVQGTLRSSLTENPNTDVGVVVNWHNASTSGTAGAQSGFFGFDRSTGRFTFIPNATRIGNTFTGAPGDIQVGTVYATGDVRAEGTITGIHLSVQDLVSPLYTGAQLVSGSNFVITGGSIDGTPIGTSIPSQGTFTYLDVKDGLIVRNSNLVANLNADLLDGKHAVEFLLRDGSQPLTGNWNAGPYVLSAGGLAALDLTETAVPFVGVDGRLVTDVTALAMKGGVLTLTKLSGYTSTGAVNLDGNVISNGVLDGITITNARISSSTVEASNVTISSGNTLDATAGTVRFADGQISGNVISGGVANTDISGTANLVRDGVYRRDFSSDNTMLKADISGQPVPLVVPEGTFVGRLMGSGTTIQALTSDEAMTQLNAVSRDLLGDNSVMKADQAGNPVSMEVPVNTIVGRSADGPIHPLNAQEVKDILQIEPITTAAIYREGALLRSGRSAEYPNGGTMTGLLLTSSERFHIATGQTPRTLDVDVETSYVICTYLRTGGKIAQCNLPNGYMDGHRKLIMLSGLAEHAFLQVSCNMVAVAAPDPCGFIFYAEGQTAHLQWDAYMNRWFVIGGAGAEVVTPDDLDEPGFLDSLARFS